MRGLPTEPRAPGRERVRALPYFVNNLVPQFRSAWIRMSRRATVAKFSMSLEILKAEEELAPTGPAVAAPPFGVVLNDRGVLLGAIENWQPQRTALAAMNPAPQTIRPDMTLRLAARLLAHAPYLLVSDAHGRYISRFRPPCVGGA